MISWLDPDAEACFPDTRTALIEPAGLLAAGGKLSVDWLISAYRQGIFPWFGDNEPILWWSPAPRTVLFPENFHVSKSLNKLSRKKIYNITKNQDFEAVIRQCAKPRDLQNGTWIVEDMIKAYLKMHDAGYAHSYECRDECNRLLGGLYGISIGKVFFGESMFSRASNASKLCLKFLVEESHYKLIDCKMDTPHLSSLGAKSINREQFEGLLKKLT